jgi:hypothetical protein
MAALQLLTAKGRHWLRHQPRWASMWLYAFPALVSYGIVMPLFCYWHQLNNFSHGMAVLLLGIVPVATSMITASLVTAGNWQRLSHFTRWDWLAIAVMVSVGHWALFMGLVSISLFLLPAAIIDQISGAFFYYMVPLSGIGWVTLLLNFMLALWSYEYLIKPEQKRTVHKLARRYSKLIVLLAWPASFTIYIVFQYLFYHFVPV